MTNTFTRFYIGMLLAAGSACAAEAANQGPRQKLIRYLDGISRSRLELRSRTIAQIKTRSEAERRKVIVRDKILGLIGGLPDFRGPVAVKEFGTLSGDGFRVEKIAFESLPGFWVTANVYVPNSGSGRFPAVLLTPGHVATGKLGQYGFGAELARMGIVAMAYDPLGQGERLQYFDASRKASLIGGPTGEHGEANVPALLIGDNLARYIIHDAMRGVDYLTARKDVEAARIGAFGCSGGGTATAYLAALDDRVKVAGSACYITSFQELLASPTGVQEAEQSIPRFIEQGLDIADWVELAAPKPYAIVSTRGDFFPFEGARQTFQEAKRIYGLYGAENRIQWITGEGPHGNLGPISPEILGFFAKHLKGAAQEVSTTRLQIERREDLICTPTGQVSTSLGGETVYSINRKRTEALLGPKRGLTGKADYDLLRSRVRQDIRVLTAAAAQPGAAPPTVVVTATERRDGYRIETIALRNEDTSATSGLVAVPDGSGAKPAVLMLHSQPKEKLAVRGGDLERLVKSGRVVMVLEPRPTPPGTEAIKSPFLGTYNLLSLHAFLVGKTIVGLRIDDTIRAVDWLVGRKDVDRSAITAYGNGPLGIVLLHAAALDTRIGRVVIEDTLASFRMIVDQPVHRDVSAVVIPGVLQKYDTGELLLAMYPRPVAVINPRDAIGAVVPESVFRKDLGYVFDSDKRLGSEHRLGVMWLGPGDPRPIE